MAGRSILQVDVSESVPMTFGDQGKAFWHISSYQNSLNSVVRCCVSGGHTWITKKNMTGCEPASPIWLSPWIVVVGLLGIHSILQLLPASSICRFISLWHSGPWPLKFQRCHEQRTRKKGVDQNNAYRREYHGKASMYVNHWNIDNWIICRTKIDIMIILIKIKINK